MADRTYIWCWYEGQYLDMYALKIVSSTVQPRVSSWISRCHRDGVAAGTRTVLAKMLRRPADSQAGFRVRCRRNSCGERP